jgi:hypothetical protein
MKLFVTNRWQLFYPIDETQHNTLAGDPVRALAGTQIKIVRKGSRTNRLLVCADHPQHGALYAWMDADQIEPLETV